MHVAEGSGETVLYGDEYYAAEKKQHGLGLVKFIGEFKLQMLAERITHEYSSCPTSRSKVFALSLLAKLWSTQSHEHVHSRSRKEQLHVKETGEWTEK
jgi:hypothetical protein